MHRSGRNRLDAVRIRIGLADAQAGQAVKALGLRSITPSRSTLHLLDYSPDCAPPSLASAGVTISVRDSGDLSLLTVQARHVRREHLHPRWLGFYSGDDETLRFEEERDRTQRVLAASFTARRRYPAQSLTRADLLLTDLLTPRQLSFLQDCAPRQPQSGPLAPFGPIPVLSWSVRLDLVDATVSQWQLPPADHRAGTALDLVEVSRGSFPSEAGFLYPALAASLRRRGLDPDGGVPWLEMRAARWLRESPQTDEHL